MIPQPNLFVLGPPRTGTSSLARWLAETPEIAVSKPKEPGYHACDLPMEDRIADKDEYLRLFGDAGDVRYRCDATPWYLYSTKAPASIHDMSPDARLVVRLRNPVDMLASLHNHHRFVGYESEPSFSRAVFRSRLPDTTDFRRQLDYLGVARIGEQVRRYHQTFSPEQIYFMRFEDSAHDPAAAHVALLEWLDLEPKPLGSYEVLNKGRQRKFKQLRPVTDWLTDTSRPRLVRSVGHRIRNANTVRVEKPVSAATRRRIMGELREDIELLSELSGLDVASWWR